MNHLAIDLETLSLEPNAHILSIGAVFFDPATGAMGDRDAMWLVNAAREQRLVMPWSYRDVFCARTLWKHSVVRADFVECAGVAHNALDDARFVATRMLEVVR